MSVKKVKISELPQLQPDTSGEGIFMPAADENNRSYRVPLSRYDNAKNEADKAASVAEKAAEGAMAAAQEANDAADRANDAAEKANGIVDNKIVVANSLSFGYREKGAVFAPPLSLRGTPQDAGSLIYRLGKSYTIDTVLPASGNLGALLVDVCQNGGDVSVQFDGRYNNGWSGIGIYHGVGEVHLMNGTPVAVVTDLGEDLGTRWMYVPNQWTKLGGAGDGDGAAEEALAAANEAKTTATAAQATADEVKKSLAGTDAPGLVVSGTTGIAVTSPEEAASCIGFGGGIGYIGINLLRGFTDITNFIISNKANPTTFTLLLNGNYMNVPVPGVGTKNIGVYGYMTVTSGFAFLVNFSGELNGAYRGAFLFADNTGWQRLPLTGITTSSNYAASGASEVPGAPEDSETESGEAVPAAVFSDTVPAVEAEAEEAETEAELGKEAIGTMENLTAGK
ncbi:MAG: hypothetical protein K2O01_04540 [Bacteroidales bacterium]|nr:hypothetical protein [Bacteroidales bacterium]